MNPSVVHGRGYVYYLNKYINCFNEKQKEDFYFQLNINENGLLEIISRKGTVLIYSFILEKNKFCFKTKQHTVNSLKSYDR